VQFLDVANNRSATYSDYIRLDTAAPTGTITINKGDLTTPKQPVTLGLTWADGTGSGVVRMRFSDNGSTWTNWMYPTATKAHRLPNPELGYQTVRVQYLDGANNYSPVYNDFIKLVEDPNDETVLLPGDVPLVMKWVPAGSFAMGSLDTDPNAESSEMPRHTVTLSGFWMGKYEVTNAQMKALTGTDPCMACLYTNGEANAPAVNLSWDDAKSFVTALSSYTGKTFRLPSEAQFQYALAAGTTTQFYWGDDSNGDGVGQYAWWYQNTYSLGDYYVQPVGHKLPNAWGLHDMVGNALEWCEDDWHDTYAGAPTNGSAWVDSPRADKRVCHDYGITAYFKQVRTAARAVYTATNADWVSGMRVVRIP
jgi:formylglycine-generating enzyme required for sulfatase activity